MNSLHRRMGIKAYQVCLMVYLIRLLEDSTFSMNLAICILHSALFSDIVVLAPSTISSP